MAEMWFSICGWEELQQQPGCEKLTEGLSSARSWKSQSNYGIFSSSNDGRVDHPTKEESLGMTANCGDYDLTVLIKYLFYD